MMTIVKSIQEQAEDLNLPDLMTPAETEKVHRSIVLRVAAELTNHLHPGVVHRQGPALQEVLAVQAEAQVLQPEVQVEVHPEAEAVADAKQIENQNITLQGKSPVRFFYKRKSKDYEKNIFPNTFFCSAK